jgi:hypothetical protein
MTTIRILSAALFVASIALTATAQAQTGAAASAPMAGAATSADCPKPMAKHDHGADKGTPHPVSMSAPCAPTTSASAPKRGSRHDHAKFNKAS